MMEFIFELKNPAVSERLIIENELAFAIPSWSPIVPGHVLIIPKRAIDSANELTEREILCMFSIRRQLHPALKKAYAAEGFNYAWNEGKLAGQTVMHLHLHMLPRKKGDSGVLTYEPREFFYYIDDMPLIEREKLIETAARIKKEL